MVKKDVVSPRSAGNLHDKASSPHPLFMSKRREGGMDGWGGWMDEDEEEVEGGVCANVNGRSNVNYLYASQSGAEKTRDWSLRAPSSRQFTVKFSDQSAH